MGWATFRAFFQKLIRSPWLEVTSASLVWQVEGNTDRKKHCEGEKGRYFKAQFKLQLQFYFIPLSSKYVLKKAYVPASFVRLMRTPPQLIQSSNPAEELCSTRRLKWLEPIQNISAQVIESKFYLLSRVLSGKSRGLPDHVFHTRRLFQLYVHTYVPRCIGPNSATLFILRTLLKRGNRSRSKFI
jgi:hypothetical protein